MKRSQQSEHALGSEAILTLVLPDDTSATPIFDDLWQDIRAFEQRFSRFRADSELSVFNANTGVKHPISQPFRKLLVTAKSMAKQTGGLYNPCILPALQRAGYKGSWPAPHKADKTLIYEDRTVVDWHDITIGDTWSQLPRDAAIDFGGIGKGYLLDELGEILDTQGITDYWLSLGGDILCSGRDVNGDAWRIGIANALATTTPVAAVKNSGKLSIATSGTTHRQGVSEAGKWHHLIDPRTGKPAQTTVLTASVCADNATTADIAAKCLVIEPGHPQLGVKDYILQTPDGTAVTIEKIGDIWA